MKLGVTTIQRDRAPWIKEWVVFHYLVGFRQFYIFLDRCTDDTEKILKKLAKKLAIKIFNVDPALDRPQLRCYHQAYLDFGATVDWMAFIDADEFLFPTKAAIIDIPLQEYSNKKISALGVYWSCFGSSDHIEEPPGLIIENYKYRAADGYHNNRHIKSLVRGGLGKSIQPPDNPHYFRTPDGTYDENMRLITSGWTDYQPTYNKFRINHYATQNRSFFKDVKSQYTMPDGGETRGEWYWQEHNQNDVLDNSMDRFINPLKNILQALDATS